MVLNIIKIYLWQNAKIKQDFFIFEDDTIFLPQIDFGFELFYWLIIVFQVDILVKQKLTI